MKYRRLVLKLTQREANIRSGRRTLGRHLQTPLGPAQEPRVGGAGRGGVPVPRAGGAERPRRRHARGEFLNGAGHAHSPEGWDMRALRPHPLRARVEAPAASSPRAGHAPLQWIGR